MITKEAKMIILYSTNCPKCKVLATKLEEKDIEFRIVDNVDEMVEKGFTSIPILEVDGEAMDFMTAVNWINQKG